MILWFGTISLKIHWYLNIHITFLKESKYSPSSVQQSLGRTVSLHKEPSCPWWCASSLQTTRLSSEGAGIDAEVQRGWRLQVAGRAVGCFGIHLSLRLGGNLLQFPDWITTSRAPLQSPDYITCFPPVPRLYHVRHYALKIATFAIALNSTFNSTFLNASMDNMLTYE